MNMLPTYPIRPKMESKESLNGYLHRFFWANGVSVPYKISIVVGNFYTTRHPSWKQFNSIQRILAGVAQFNKELWAGSHLPRYKLNDGWYFSVLPQDINFCPICLKQLGYYLHCWELPLFRACPIHLCKLVSHCPNCKALLTWHTLINWACECGVPLRTMATTQASDSLIEQSRFLSCITTIPIPPNYIFRGYEGGFQGQLTATQAYVTILLLQDVHQEMYRQHYQHRLRYRNILYANQPFNRHTSPVPPVFFNWPDNFISWLDTFIFSNNRNHSTYCSDPDYDVKLKLVEARLKLTSKPRFCAFKIDQVTTLPTPSTSREIKGDHHGHICQNPPYVFPRQTLHQ